MKKALLAGIAELPMAIAMIMGFLVLFGLFFGPWWIKAPLFIFVVLGGGLGRLSAWRGG
jgi:hypothetical protein